MKAEAPTRNYACRVSENGRTTNAIVETPWNVCDRRCERCALASDCRLYLSDVEARERAAPRGLDPDSPKVALQLVGESLAKALELAAQAAEELGISIDDDEPAPEPPDAGRTFAEAGRAYADAAREAARNLPPSAVSQEATFVAFLVAAKTARLTFDLPMQEVDPARDDVRFNLLLIGTLLRRAQALVAAAFTGATSLDGVERAAAELRRQLDGHLQGVRREDHRALVDLIRAGPAPSPFCVTMTPPPEPA